MVGLRQGGDGHATVEEVFADRYKILTKLGSGGFGTVYKAHDTKLGIDVALKVVNASAADENALQRFQREAHVLAKLSHENIVKIYDYGVHESSPFYTMEFVEGDSLESVVQTNRILPVRAAVRIARDVALALHHGHINGVVHRDVKPQNVMIQPKKSDSVGGKEPTDKKASFASSKGLLSEYRVVLTDFGLAKDFEAAAKLSMTGELMGTPYYMSPEQASGQNRLVGPQTDVYSTGVMLYFMLTGKLPFTAEYLPEILEKIRMTDPPLLKSLAPDLPRDLCAVVEKAMHKDTVMRYKSALDFAQDCENFLKGESVSAKPAPITYRVKRVIKRNLALSASVASAILVGAALLVYFGYVAPAMKQREVREAFDKKRRSFIEEKSRIESTARARLEDSSRNYRDGKFDAAIECAQGMIAEFDKYSKRSSFPIDEFRKRDLWDERFADAVPFSIPVIDNYLIVARSHEMKGQIQEATKNYMRAYLDGTDSGDESEACFELASFFFRTDNLDQALHFFKRLIEFESDRGIRNQCTAWARYLVGFACCAAGRYDEAIIAFEKCLAGGLPAAVPSYKQFRSDEMMTPLYELQPTKDIVKDALEICRMYAGGRQVVKVSDSSCAKAADIDADGRSEILVAAEGSIDVYGTVGEEVKKVRTLRIPRVDIRSFGLEANDIDGDSIPELFCHYPAEAGVERGSEVFKIGREGLVSLYAGSVWANGVSTDLDGCGKPELITAGEHYLRIIRFQDQKFEVIAEMEFKNTDVSALKVVDLNGDGTSEILLVLGPWQSADAFSILVIEPDLKNHKLEITARKKIGWAGNIQIVPSGSGNGRTIFFCKSIPGAYSRPLDIAFERSGIDKNMGLCKIEFANGNFGRVEHLWGTKMQKAAEYACGLLPIAGKGEQSMIVALTTEEKRRIIRIAPSGDLRYVPLKLDDPSGFENPLRNSFQCDIDGDGMMETVAFPDNVMTVYGLPSKTRRLELENSGGTSRIGVENLARYQDALQTFSAFVKAKEFAGAAAYLRDLTVRFPEFSKEILFKLAETYETAEKWQETYDTLKIIRGKFYHDMTEISRVDKWMTSLQDILRQQERILIEFSKKENLNLLCNDPLKFRIDREKGQLKAFAVANDCSFLAFPCTYDGGPYSLNTRFRVDRLEYFTGFTIGFSDGVRKSLHTNVYLQELDNWTANFGICAIGNVSCVDSHAEAQFSTADAPLKDRISMYGIGVFPDGKWISSSFSYIRHRDRFRLSMSDDESGRNICSGVLNCDARPTSQYGAIVLTTSRACYSNYYWNEIDINRIALKSAGDIRLRVTDPIDMKDTFLRAGGRFVTGDYFGSADDYKKALKTFEEGKISAAEFAYPLPNQSAFVPETKFLLSFALLHLGKREEADGALLSALAASPEVVVKKFLHNFLAMTEEEKTFFRANFWKAFDGKNPAETMGLLTKEFSLIELGGYLAFEALVLTGRDDTATAMQLLEQIAELQRKRGRHYGIRLAVLLRTRARLFKQMHRDDEALAALNEAIAELDSPNTDDYYRIPYKPEFDNLLAQWKDY